MHKLVSALSLVIPLAGCPGTSTELSWKVKDPKQVVLVNGNAATVLAAGASSGQDGPVSLQRAESGQVEMSCGDPCPELHREILVHSDGQAFGGFRSDWDGISGYVAGYRASPNFTNSIDFLVASSTSGDYMTGTTTLSTTYSLGISTPWNNVEKIHARRTVNQAPTLVGMAIGAAVAIAGAALISDSSITNYLLAYPSLALGAFMVGHGAYYEVFGPKDWDLYPP